MLELSKPEAVSATQFGLVLSVVPLANGRLLVNDAARRQLVVLDANLSNASVLIDSAAVGGQAYGPVASPLIPYIGDSTLFVDGVARALLLISPQGTISRTMAPPNPSDIRYLTFGSTGTDRNGSLIYLSRFPLNPSSSAENMIKHGNVAAGLPLEAYCERMHIAYGHPDEVAAYLLADQVFPYATDLILQFNPATPPLDQAIGLLEQIATQIAPALGWRASGQ